MQGLQQTRPRKDLPQMSRTCNIKMDKGTRFKYDLCNIKMDKGTRFKYDFSHYMYIL